jgi:hypothetical protein
MNGPSGIINIDEAGAVAGRASDPMRIQLARRYKFMIRSLPREQASVQDLKIH